MRRSVIGRPINKKYLGDPNLTNRTYPALMMSSAWMLGQNAISTNPVYIIKQTGQNSYYCSDGTNFGIVMLQGSAPTAPGQGNIVVTPFNPTAEGGATFTFTYKVAGATVATAGTGYAVNDTLTYPNGVLLKVATINGSQIATVSVVNVGSTTSVTPTAANAVAATSTSGAGTGALLNLNWELNTGSVTGGTGYTSGEAIQFTGFNATTVPVATISGVSNTGAPTGVTVTNAGSRITQSASASSGSDAPAVSFASKITNRTVDTFDDHDYMWNCFVTASVVGQANLPFSGTGSEQNTYMSGSELQSISGSPYFSSNYGSVSAKEAQIFATGGESGGLGSQVQASADVGGTTGVYNTSATQRRAPTETRTKRLARLAEEKTKQQQDFSKESTEYAERKNKADVNIVTSAEVNKAKTPDKQVENKKEEKVKEDKSANEIASKVGGRNQGASLPPKEERVKEKSATEETNENTLNSYQGPLAELAKKEENLQESHEHLNENTTEKKEDSAIHEGDIAHIEGNVKFS